MSGRQIASSSAANEPQEFVNDFSSKQPTRSGRLGNFRKMTVESGWPLRIIPHKPISKFRLAVQDSKFQEVP
jgi:hypothetical protein